MDDFLHNLRSGNLRKPNTGNRRQYNDPQGKHPNRRIADRRKKDNDQRLAAETLDTVKTLLQQLTAGQEELLAAQKERAATEVRMTEVLERIAASLESAGASASTATAASSPATPPPPAPETLELGEKISRWRDQRLSYARIADRLNQEGIPTPSGRGQWRGTTVQRVFQRHTQSAA